METYTIDNGTVTWDNANNGDWSHGEIDTQKVFPIPPAGSSTIITWNLGSASVTTADTEDDSTANRPMMGVVSAFETDTWSLQHYQNTTGGIWADITNMSGTDTTGVTGNIHYGDDTKVKDTNATTFGGFGVTDWNWETDSQDFSLEMTNTGFTWFAGDTELGSGSYADAGLDAEPGGEFSKGFRVIFVAAAYRAGLGTISLNSVDIQNGAAGPTGPPKITDIVDNNDGTVTLTWTSNLDAEYVIETNTSLEAADWTEFTDGVIGTETTTSYSVDTDGEKLFFRVIKL